jgi:hypothetical protein
MAAQDIAEVVPRVRRALEGPIPVNPALTDEAVKAVAADAVADLILLTDGRWTHTLSITARDSTTTYPTEWAVDPALTLPEQSLVAFQAALTNIGVVMRDMKVSERIRNEAQEWEWQISASGIRDWLKALTEQRDAALQSVFENNPVLVRVASILHARDPVGAALIERFVPESQEILPSPVPRYLGDDEFVYGR